MVKLKKLIFVILLTFNSICLYSQEAGFSNSSLTAGLGPAFNAGERETGMGVVFSFGYQKSFWKDRLRVNPNILAGGFIPFGITDTRDQYYRVTSLGVNGYLDALKYRSVSLFIGTGVFVNYSRGLLGTGGDSPGNEESEYFFKLYYGGSFSTGIRIDPKKSRFAYELTPLNLYFGTDYFILGFMKLGLDIKLKANKQ